MAAKLLFILPLVLCFVERGGSVTPVITISPPNIQLPPGNASNGETITGASVSISCQATAVGANINLLIISVERQRVGDSSPQTMVTLTPSNGNLTGSYIASATKNDANNKLTVSLTAECADAGNYTCKILFYNTVSGDADPVMSTKSLAVEVIPGPIDLTVDPSGKTDWTVNQTLTLRCNSPLGTVNAGSTQIDWMWRYRQGSVGSWSEYNSTVHNDVAEADPTSHECYQRQLSTLTRTLTLADNDREYQCYIRRNGIPYVQFAATHSVGTVTETAATTTTQSTGSGGGSGQPSKSGVGGIIGGVIAALVVIVVVIVIVVIVVRRRSNKGETYGADESGHKPAEDPNGAPYAPDPAVTYSQPHRYRDREPKGMTNKAMDETGDKPSPRENRPPRYANDFHQGRPNRGYDSSSHDGRGRDYHQEPPRGGRSRYSSEEDGTDSRVNTSQMSLPGLPGQGDSSIGTAI